MVWDSLLGHCVYWEACFLMYDLKKVDKISHAEIRNILLKHGIKYTKSKTVLSNKSSSDIEEYDLKKIHSKTKIQYAKQFCTFICG